MEIFFVLSFVAFIIYLEVKCKQLEKDAGERNDSEDEDV